MRLGPILGVFVELILNAHTPTAALCLYDSIDDPIVSRFRWYLVRVGVARKPYVFTRLANKTISMHRLILAASCEGLWVDHKNGNGLDNRRENLRVCTPAQNHQNAPGWITRKCAYKGVSKVKRVNGKNGGKPWEARICVNRKQAVVGLFKTPKEAALAYDSKARLLHGRFARLNFPLTGEMGLS